MASSDAPLPKLSPGFVGIIVFKMAKSAAFLLLGAAAFRIARLPHQSEPMEIARFLGVNGRGVLVQHLSFVLAALTSRQVEAIGAAAILIGLVFAAEGMLLAARVPWAPYFTIVLTALGIPPELIEIARRPGSGRRYALLAVNVAILVYLWKRRNEFRIRPEA
ncbi:MAG TPA: DUF2127 domain-containing protein [Thermoanaerobaculia bacterium]|nr:DUF2127 domain-containing protein [Thermoanaerobaculia bacterium]